MANSPEINTEYETFKEVSERKVINLVLEKGLDYKSFIKLNEGKFKIVKTTYYTIANMIYRLKVKEIEKPSVKRTYTNTDDLVENIAILASLQNINSDIVYESEATSLRDKVESEGNLKGILLNLNNDKRKLNQPLNYKRNSDTLEKFLVNNKIKEW